MLFISDVPIHCINESAYEYHIPAKLIIAVLNVEQGRVGMAKKNSNGSYDLGPMQINTSWWPKFDRMGLSEASVRYDACTNVRVGAWILSKNIADGSNLYRGIGDYNSQTMKYNQRYTILVREKYTQLKQVLNT